jgi:hypothetical protein
MLLLLLPFCCPVAVQTELAFKKMGVETVVMSAGAHFLLDSKFISCSDMCCCAQK